MHRDEVIARLRSVEPDLRTHGVAALFLFGSHSRGEARPASDVDVFVDKVPGKPFGFDQLMGSYNAVRNALPGIDVSFGTREGLSKYIRDEVEKEAVRVF